MSKVVSMTARGRLTLPAETRRALGIRGEGRFQVDVDDGKVILRPAVVIPEEDAWAYTPEHRALLERAHRDSREGRVRRLTEEDLERIAEEADRIAEGERAAPATTG